jgi:putative ABC transport system substrate-binding protein
MGGKWLALLKEMVPSVARVAIMQNPKHPSGAGYQTALGVAASALGLQASPAPVNTSTEIDQALENMALEPNAGLLVLPDTFNTVHRDRIITLANRHRLPAIYPTRFFATDGGLVSYGADVVELVSSHGDLC